MKKILDGSATGQFAREWILENKANAPAFKAMRARTVPPIEEVGRQPPPDVLDRRQRGLVFTENKNLSC